MMTYGYLFGERGQVTQLTAEDAAKTIEHCENGGHVSAQCLGNVYLFGRYIVQVHDGGHATSVKYGTESQAKRAFGTAGRMATMQEAHTLERTSQKVLTVHTTQRDGLTGQPRSFMGFFAYNGNMTKAKRLEFCRKAFIGFLTAAGRNDAEKVWNEADERERLRWAETNSGRWEDVRLVWDYSRMDLTYYHSRGVGSYPQADVIVEGFGAP